MLAIRPPAEPRRRPAIEAIEEGPMRTMQSTLAVAIVLSLAAIAPANEADAAAMPKDQFKCADFKKLADGTFLSSPTAKLGSKDFANQSVGPVGYNGGDGKLYNVIAQKCGSAVKACLQTPCWN
jgi:hypothetical protein